MELKDFKDFVSKESDRLQDSYLKGYDLEKRILHAAVKANEEMGELCDVTLKKIGAQRKSKLEELDQQEIEDEIADVMITTGILAHLMGINVETALISKMKKIDTRFKEGKY